MPSHALAIGCVSFLNSRPLIHGLDDHDDLAITYDVPSALLEDLLTRQVDLALCPVIDFQLSDQPLEIVPVGGIGCDGPTLTVRLFSRVPFEQVRQVAIDHHSHTSNMLMRVVLHDLYGRHVELITPETDGPPADAALLIGDKVVNAAPPTEQYPYQLDLGEAWKELTGLPFVFAVWMCRAGADLQRAPALLAEQQRHNADRIELIARDWAPRVQWPEDLARQYLGDYLKYGIGQLQLQAMQRFWQRAHELEFLTDLRPLQLHGASPQGVS